MAICRRCLESRERGALAPLSFLFFFLLLEVLDGDALGPDELVV